MTKTNIQKHIRPRKGNNITHHVSYKKFFSNEKNHRGNYIERQVKS
jgi:hypothetical protein